MLGRSEKCLSRSDAETCNRATGQETKNSQQNNHLNYLHVRTQRKMSTQIGRRNLLRLIGDPRGKPTISAKKAIHFFISVLGNSE